MADPVIRIKRSSVEGKIPTPDQVPLGEVALNTFDGKFYASKNVGIGTTVFIVNPWTVGTGTNTYNTYFTAGNVGIGSTLPSAILDVVGDAKFTGIVTAIDGRLISGIGINTASGNVGYGVTTLDFRGSGISTITISSGVATINLVSSAGAATTQTPGRTVTSYTTTAGISTYDVTYEVGYLDVFLNGIRLDSTEYTATTGTNIILSQGPSDGDSLDLIYYTLGIGDTGPQGANGADGTPYWVQTDVGIHTLSSVGIGTTNPTSKLTVSGDVNIIGIITATSFVKSGGTSSEFLKADGTSDSNTYITGVGIQSGGTIVGYGVTTLNFVGTGNTFAINGTTVDISISGSGGGGGGGESYWIQTDVGIHTLGSVGIGTTNPTSKLTVSGDVLVVGVITATDFNSSSDITLKNNIFPIKNPIDKIIKINGVNFEWKENNKKSAGVIAQEIEKIMPELVSDAEIKSVNYNGLIGLLIEVVKEQQKQIDEINSLLKTLQINT